MTTLAQAHTTMSKIHCLHVISAREWGGGESYVYNLAKYAIENGDSISLVTDSRASIITAHFQTVLQPVTLRLDIASIPQNIYKLCHLIKTKKITHLCYHSGKVALTCVLAARLARVPCIFFKHNITSGKTDLYHRYIIEHLEAVVCVSDTVRQQYSHNLPDVFIKKFHTILTGVPIHSVVENQQQDSILRIGYAGRIVQNKGIEVLLKAFLIANIPNAELLIAGDTSSPYCAFLKQRYESSKIHFIGLQDDMDSFYRSLNIFIAPSIVPEAFGLSICEAMSYGLPVISTTSGAQKELINNGINGILVSPGIVSELCDAMQELVFNKLKRTTLGKNASTTVSQRFSFPIFYQKIMSLLSSL